jgi:hypothetical protein
MVAETGKACPGIVAMEAGTKEEEARRMKPVFKTKQPG